MSSKISFLDLYTLTNKHRIAPFACFGVPLTANFLHIGINFSENSGYESPAKINNK